MEKTLSKSATAENFTTATTVASNVMNPPTEIINESDISVIVADRKTINDKLKALDKSVSNAEKSFISIALGLRWFKDTNAFCEIEGKGYERIEQFAKDRYGIGRATTFNYLAIVEKFGVKNDRGEYTGLSDTYKDFSMTKLLYMLPMDDGLLAKCKPKMTVLEIKKIASEMKCITAKETTADADTADSTDADTADSEKTGKKAVTRTVYENTQELYSIKSVDDLEKHAKEILDALKKALSQNNGTDYGISIQMFW